MIGVQNQLLIRHPGHQLTRINLQFDLFKLSSSFKAGYAEELFCMTRVQVATNIYLINIARHKASTLSPAKLCLL